MVWLLLHPPSQYSQGGEGVSASRASGPDTETKVEGVLGRMGQRRGRGQNQVWSSARRLQTPLSPPGLLQFSFASEQGQYTPLPIPSDSGGSHPTPLCGLFLPAALLPPCCPCAYAGCGPSTLPCGSSQRPPGSGESGPRDRARSFIRFLLLARPILGAALGAREALCQAPYRFVGLLSPSLLKTQYQRLRNNPQGHTDPKFEPKSNPVPFLQLRCC